MEMMRRKKQVLSQSSLPAILEPNSLKGLNRCPTTTTTQKTGAQLREGQPGDAKETGRWKSTQRLTPARPIGQQAHPTPCSRQLGRAERQLLQPNRVPTECA